LPFFFFFQTAFKQKYIYIVIIFSFIMARNNTFWGAYDISLENELKEHQKKLKEMGIANPSKMEASALVARKAKKGKLSEAEIKKIIAKRRGLLF